ncbi:MAG: lysylphosphatidylglycerol synthase transmembrane domain-containing protein [Vicinamibacterales bacterium]|nr:lysylphosphatidylglycerol synthase transmembrane domain-containing protein [Vicinamibacterales bacterium]
MSSVPSSSAAPRWRVSPLNLALAVIGLLLLVLTVRQVGWDSVREGLASLGWWFLAIVALGGLRFAARTRSWMACAAPVAGDAETAPLGFRHTFGAVLAADALGNVTPLGLLASEPAKVLLVRRRLSTATGLSSVATDNVFYTTSVLLMIAVGAIVFFRRAAVPPNLALAGQGLVVLALASLVVAFLVARRRPAVLSRLAEVAARVTGRAKRSPDFLREVEHRFYALLQWPAGRIARVAGWQVVFHVAAIAEVYLVLRLLPGASEATLVDAFVLETAGRLVTVLFKFVPFRLGVDEAGAALVARALQFDPTVGVALALVRRLRIFCWNGAGLVILGWMSRQPDA